MYLIHRFQPNAIHSNTFSGIENMVDDLNMAKALFIFITYIPYYNKVIYTWEQNICPTVLPFSYRILQTLFNHPESHIHIHQLAISCITNNS